MTVRDLVTLYKDDARVQQLTAHLARNKAGRAQVKGLVGSADAFVASAAWLILHAPCLFILPDREEAAYFHADLESLLGTEVLLFPSAYRKPFEFTQPDTANVLARAEVLNALKYDDAYGKLLVTYPEALAEKVVNRQLLEENTLLVQKGAKLGIDFINEFLTDYNFERQDFVYEPGQFSIRGGIVDIFSFSAERPYRIEFFGDEVESIRSFDIESQLSIQEVHELTILPNVQAGFLNTGNISLLEYVPAATHVWIKDVTFLLDVARDGFAKAEGICQGLATADKQANTEWLPPGAAFSTDKELSALLQNLTVVEFGKQFLYSGAEVVQFDTTPQPSFNKDFNLLIHNLKQNEARGMENFIFTNSAKQLERLYSILEDIDKSATFNPVHVALREGFADNSLKKAFYTDHQIFDRYYKYRGKRGYQRSQSLTLKELRELKPGDYITHIDHGVGKYAGLEKVDVNGKLQEMIRLVYADNDLLYVNINSLNRIAKFSGKEGAVPKVNKLGTDTWDKLKKTTKKKVKDIARDLIKLYALRKAQEGTAFSPDTYLQTELEASFLYEDTPDQLKATADVKKDMEAPHPMDRLICGDVGFGKTEIAIRAAFKAVTDGKQAAVLVPTTILALQHYKTFKSRLDGLPVKVDYINRFKTPKQIKATLQEVAEGKTEIIIGTHRLLSKDVKFKDLGLMIVDEEQKFGVSSKEKLKAIKVNVDTLTLTATPIPRTLHFSLMGARDLSIISTPPPNRQPVTTELHVFNDKLIQEAVQFELDRNGQVFFIHNRVADLPQLGALIKQLVPKARIGIAHGQLEGDDMEDEMLAFINGEHDVLVATTIIEAGLDIPNANTIIINHAHMFGLSDLHQMRGRVGRSNKKAYCYLLSPPLSTLTQEARKRLSAIEEFSELGSGFNVAMRDLDIRGSGNLLGAEQSGFISEIGFDMYHKILDEAIQELKESEFKDLFADQPEKPFVQYTQVDTDLEMYIPDGYVTNITERYNLYTDIAALETPEALKDFVKQLTDRFGPVPAPVQTMLKVVELQWLGKQLGFEKLTYKNGVLRGYFIGDKQSAYFDSAAFKKIVDFAITHPGICNLKEVKNTLRIAFNNVPDVQQAIEILRQV